MPTRYAHTLRADSRLPAELVSLIVDACKLCSPNSTLVHFYRYLHRKLLSSASLVCKHWCTELRPLLFRDIVLRCKADVQKLLQFSSRPGCRISAFMREVSLIESDDAWILAASGLLPAIAKRLPHLQSLLFDGGYSVDFPVRMAPFAIPAVMAASMSTFAVVTSLTLRHAHFKTFQQFSHFIGSLPLLESLSCQQVRWMPAPTDSIAPRSPRISGRLVHIEANRCSDDWRVLLLFSTSSARARRKPRFTAIAHDDIAALAGLLQFLSKFVTLTTLATFRHWRFRRTRGAVSVSVTDMRRDPRAPRVEWLRVTAGLDLQKHAEQTQADSAEVNAIRTILFKIGEDAMMQIVDWDAAGALLPCFSRLRRLHLVLESQGSPSMETFYTVSCRLAQQLRAAQEMALVLSSSHPHCPRYHVPSDEDKLVLERMHRYKQPVLSASALRSHEGDQEQMLVVGGAIHSFRQMPVDGLPAAYGEEAWV